MLEVQVTVSLDLYYINYMAITTIVCKSAVLEITQRDLLKIMAQISE